MRDSARLAVHVRLAIANWPEDTPRGSVSAFCREHGIARSWFYELRELARAQGPLAVVRPRSTAPKRQAAKTPDDVVAVALAIRADLIGDGWDGGPISVRHVLLERGLPAPSGPVRSSV